MRDEEKERIGREAQALAQEIMGSVLSPDLDGATGMLKDLLISLISK